MVSIAPRFLKSLGLAATLAGTAALAGCYYGPPRYAAPAPYYAPAYYAPAYYGPAYPAYGSVDFYFGGHRHYWR